MELRQVVVALHISVVGLSLSGLGLTGVGIDLIGHRLAPQVNNNKLPRAIIFAAQWPAINQLVLIAALILGFAPLDRRRTVCRGGRRRGR